MIATWGMTRQLCDLLPSHLFRPSWILMMSVVFFLSAVELTTTFILNDTT